MTWEHSTLETKQLKLILQVIRVAICIAIHDHENASWPVSYKLLHETWIKQQCNLHEHCLNWEPFINACLTKSSACLSSLQTFSFRVVWTSWAVTLHKVAFKSNYTIDDCFECKFSGLGEPNI